MKSVRTVWPPVVTFALVLLAWAGGKWLFDVRDFTLPSPWDVFRAFAKYRTPLLSATLNTGIAAFTGFAMSVVGGIAVGTLLSSSRLIERAVYPFTVFLQTVPLVAIAPLLVLWFETGFKSVTLCAFIVSVFPVIANTLMGMRSVDPSLHDLFTIYSSSRFARLLKLKLPAALPSIFTGLRVAAGLAVIGAIVGEFSAGTFDKQGLGILILAAKRSFNMDEVFAAVVLSSVLGLVAFAGVNLASWLCLHHWHASERDAG